MSNVLVSYIALSFYDDRTKEWSGIEILLLFKVRLLPKIYAYIHQRRSHWLDPSQSILWLNDIRILANVPKILHSSKKFSYWVLGQSKTDSEFHNRINFLHQAFLEDPVELEKPLNPLVRIFLLDKTVTVNAIHYADIKWLLLAWI